MSETQLMREIQVSAPPNVRLFRNQVGEAWQGQILRSPDGSIYIKHPRLVSFGLAKGSSDLIGIEAVTITQDMVGQTFGRFIALEVKLPTNYRRPEDQKDFIAMVRNLGGTADFVNSVQNAAALIANT